MKRVWVFILVLGSLVSGGAALAERLAISVPVANIRSGPGTNYDVLWKVERYFPIEVTRTSGSWLFFEDFEGDKGWVHRSLTDKLPAVVTRTDQCNVRSGPGTGHPRIYIIERGVPFKVLERKGEWIQVEHAKGAKGWIHRSLVW